ncbi:hypothetical protein B7494_g6065 [Chlorociboria aeruginascens]|nr:hypothetical protein B7494_g6065 [Chlorociboria aeruginascens]
MTPQPTPAELSQRSVLDVSEGTIHLIDLVEMVKDGLYAKDIISDHIIGVLLMGKELGVVAPWEGTLFQVPFVRGMKVRVRSEHIGRPFAGPDGKALKLGGRWLHGATPNAEKSDLATIEEIQAHPQYEPWLRATLYAGRHRTQTEYIRVRTAKTLSQCDNYVNTRPYTPGPLSVAPNAADAEPAAPPLPLTPPGVRIPETEGQIQPRARSAPC